MNFKTKASRHQQWFRENVMGIISFDKYPCMLTDDDALGGGNFYTQFPAFMETVKKRYKKFRKPMYKNMLRSEHIPFNFFIPLQCNLSDVRVLAFFKEIFPELSIQHLVSIEIEKSPQGRQGLSKSPQYLDDNTSLDVFVTYQSPTGFEAIGIEIKYTEKSYPYGRMEKERMHSWNSLYHKRHIESGIYKPNTIPLLRIPKLKQLWRNHLLGLAMIQKGDIKRFTSVHMYPDGNIYQSEAAEAYSELLRDECKNTFRSLTFERFIVIGQELFYQDTQWEHWLKYLEQRYLF